MRMQPSRWSSRGLASIGGRFIFLLIAAAILPACATFDNAPYDEARSSFEEARQETELALRQQAAAIRTAIDTYHTYAAHEIKRRLKQQVTVNVRNAREALPASELDAYFGKAERPRAEMDAYNLLLAKFNMDEGEDLDNDDEIDADETYTVQLQRKWHTQEPQVKRDFEVLRA